MFLLVASCQMPSLVPSQQPGKLFLPLPMYVPDLGCIFVDMEWREILTPPPHNLLSISCCVMLLSHV